ncbi:hypothetical protein TNCV_4230071 [Trichonephila clavipes]|uniref:Uncharacterized protein n=1 Tax=Trichonephila clavipes TaxID=2585209 RepID=A0A8X6SR85_TRICX|nr:hypothetical protein TNCV_4230071 [Trichonephila clavipes]
MPSIGGYNLRPSRGAKKGVPTIQLKEDTTMRTSSIQKKRRETTVQTLRQGAKKVKQQEYQKQEWSTTALPGEERKNEQPQITLSGGSSRTRKLQEIKIRLYGFNMHFSDRQSRELLQHANHDSHLKKFFFF